MSYMSKFVAALVVVLAMAVIASRQIFLSVTKDPSGLSAAGIPHLWLALGAGISACIAGSLMFHFFIRYEEIRLSKVGMTPAGPLPIVLGGNLFLNRRARVPFDGKRRALTNVWLSEGQADDRIPMDGSVTDNGETSSGQRSFARRTHQLMFKKWSQARHD